MIAYFCKYAPIEVLEAMGAEPVRLQSSVGDFSQADSMMHPNVCSFVKAVFEDYMAGDYEGIVLTSCCDSVRRLADVLREHFPEDFIYMIDVPRKVNEFSADIFTEKIKALIKAYGSFSGKSFSPDEFRRIIERDAASSGLMGAPGDEKGINIGLTGARCPGSIRTLLMDHRVNILFDMSCTGFARSFELREGEEPVRSYAWELLNQLPCLRMVEASGRERFIEGYLDRLEGIICHSVKFCDMYSFEYIKLKERYSLPMLMVETDSSAQSEGQMRTRVEAFIESLSGGREKKNYHIEKGENETMYVLGVDSGSTSTNAVILDDKKNIVAYEVIRTGAKSGDSAQQILETVLKKAGLKRDDIALIFSTGYGRVSIPYADENITEISCHGRGAHYYNLEVRTVLDIGGQDSKAISLNEKGEVTDFVMNDKCAAGTGRFLEMMARTLEIGVEELGPVSLQSKEDIEITSMCSVFAESEVISLIARNREISDIAHGIHRAIAGRAASLIGRVGLKEVVMMTGGVAKNQGLIKALEEKLGTGLYICEQPEIVGALGAALYALDKLQ